MGLWMWRYESCTGSDHYPITADIEGEVSDQRQGRRVFRENRGRKKEILGTDESQDVDNSNIFVLESSRQHQSQSHNLEGRLRGKQFSGGQMCGGAESGRNRASRLLKRAHNYDNLVAYKGAEALVGRTKRHAKRK